MAQTPTGLLSERLALVDAVDTLLNRGVVLTGEATLSLAGVDLVYLGLNLVLSSVETLERHRGDSSRSGGADQPVGRSPERAPGATGFVPLPAARPLVPAEAAAGFVDAPAPLPDDALDRDVVDDGRPDRGLAQLVLTLVELLRQLLERQAIRRLEGDSLTEAQIERMGRALLELEAKMAELRDLFDLTEADLNLDLGPLGQLI